MMYAAITRFKYLDSQGIFDEKMKELSSSEFQLWLRDSLKTKYINIDYDDVFEFAFLS